MCNEGDGPAHRTVCQYNKGFPCGSVLVWLTYNTVDAVNSVEHVAGLKLQNLPPRPRARLRPRSLSTGHPGAVWEEEAI